MNIRKLETRQAEPGHHNNITGFKRVGCPNSSPMKTEVKKKLVAIRTTTKKSETLGKGEDAHFSPSSTIIFPDPLAPSRTKKNLRICR
jgi:hypothetical protein